MAHRRLASKEFLVYSGDPSSDWRIIRNTSFVEGERRVEQGVYQRVFDDMTGKHCGYRVLDRKKKTDEDIPFSVSTPMLTARDTLAIAGAFGESQTIGLDEDERLERRDTLTGKRLEPEDFIEKAIEKAKVFGSSPIRGVPLKLPAKP